MDQQAELQMMRDGMNCAVLLERHAWLLDQRESTRNCLKYRRGAGEIVLVTHEGRGWWHPGSAARGDVFNLVQFLEPGLNFGQVRKMLRPLVGTQPSFAPAVSRPARQRNLSVGQRWRSRLPVRPGSVCWRYLTGERCLPPAIVQAAVHADGLREGPFGSAWFAYRRQDGQISGIEMRGPRYRGFSPGGEKTLFRFMTTEADVQRVVVTEAPIDALSLAAIEGARGDSLYLSTAGGMGPGTIAALEQLLKSLACNPNAVLVAATDADEAGDGHADRLMAMAANAGVRSERLRPANGLKDWNDIIKKGCEA